MSQSRPRTVAKRNVTCDAYINALRHFRGSQYWASKLSKSLLKDCRITPRDIVTLQPLVLELMAIRLMNCMVTLTKLEQTFRMLSDEELSEGFTIDTYAQALANHVRISFNFVRTLCAEEQDHMYSHSAASRLRRFPKTSTFRRPCTSADS